MRFNTAASYLMYLLSKREYCTAQVRTKLLCKGFDHQEVEEAIAEAKAKHFLSDARFVNSFIDDQANLSNCGKLQIINKLRAKGMNNMELIEDTIRALDINWGKVCTQFLLQKRYTSQDFKDLKTRQKILRTCLAKGFTLDEVKFAQNALAKSEEELELEDSNFNQY